MPQTVSARVFWAIIGISLTLIGAMGNEISRQVREQMNRQEMRIMELEKAIIGIDTKLSMVIDEIRRNEKSRKSDYRDR